MKKASYYLLDVFTDRMFSGNQLAVFPDARQVEESLMQPIAREMNLSETVFIYPKNEDGSFDMRIFTPTQELPTAGHPTIGSAYYLSRKVDHMANDTTDIVLNQKVGQIRVTLDIKNNAVQKATMFQPLPIFGKIYDDRSALASLISIAESDLMDFPIQEVSCGVPFLIIPVKSIETVEKIRFRLDLWDKLKAELDNAFVYVFTPHGSLKDSDLHGRMFAPEAGILEDPATGSANGPLGCYVTHYHIKHGPFVSEQGFELGRPSIIHIEIDCDERDRISQVKVGGQSVFVGQGEIFMDNI